MNLAISAVNTLSTRAQATSQKIVQMIDQQYSNIIQMIRVRKRLLELKKLMNKARSYSQWKEYAVEYDTLKSNCAAFSFRLYLPSKFLHDAAL